jgi:hypothetical protein
MQIAGSDARRNDATNRRKTWVHYLVSPPHCPDGPATSQSYTYRTAGENAAADSVNTDCLTRLEVASRECFVRFFNEPRAAFYTEKRGKKQNKNVRVAALSGKIATAIFHKCDASKKAGNGIKI